MIWPILQSLIISLVWLMTLKMDFLVVNNQGERGLLCPVQTQEVLAVKELDLLLFVYSNHFGIRLSSSLMIFLDHNGRSGLFLQLNSKVQHIISILGNIPSFKLVRK